MATRLRVRWGFDLALCSISGSGHGLYCTGGQLHKGVHVRLKTTEPTYPNPETA